MKVVLPVFLATVWISVSEFVRNEFFFKSYWVSHYEQLGLKFPDAPVNGAMWGIWALVFSSVIYYISKKHTLTETFLLSWVLGFVLMWIVIGNLGVLPFNLLFAAVPLSLLEAYVAAFIIFKLAKK